MGSGGARAGSGRKPLAEDARPYKVTLDATTIQALREAGNGSISAGIRATAQRKEAKKAAARVVLVSAKDIDVSPFHGRHAIAFSSDWYRRLKASMEHHQKNLVPVLLNAGDSGRFELAYGRLRLQAALELGIPLLAMVARQTRDEAVCAMVADFAGGLAWSVFERGTAFKRIVDADLLGTKRSMAMRLGEDLNDMNAALEMVNLPPKLLAMFSDPREIRLKWSRELTSVEQRDPDRLREAVRAGAPLVANASALKVYESLKNACFGSWNCPPAR